MMMLRIRRVLAESLGRNEDDDAGGDRFASWQAEERFYFFNIVGVILNLAFVALLAGLYLGLLTLDVMDLQILERVSKDDDERRYAKEILPIVKERHLLLVTILLVDSLAYESLPIFMEALMPGWVAILLSSTLILVFGEILPSGIFTGPNQLYLAYTMSPMVKFCMWLFYPVANPVAQLLDYLTRDGESGEDAEAYDREELSALVRIQHEERMRKQSIYRRPSIKEVIKYQRNKDRQWNSLKVEIMDRVNEMHSEAVANFDNMSDDNDTETASRHYSIGGGGGAAMDQLVPPLHATEVDMVEGALSLGLKLAMDVYTPFTHVYALPEDLILDKATVTDIFYEGYSRVPIYRPNPNNPEDHSAYLGFLVTRHLMMIDWQDNREISTLYLKRPTCVSPRTNLVDVLRVLQNTGPQIAFVCARPDLANKALGSELPIPVEAGLMGIVTLVDIMESILQDRIYDEEDIRDRDRAVNTLTRWAATKLQSFLLKKTKNTKKVSIVVPPPPQNPQKPGAGLALVQKRFASYSSPSRATGVPTTTQDIENGTSNGTATSTETGQHDPYIYYQQHQHNQHHHHHDMPASTSPAAMAAETIYTSNSTSAPSETTPLLSSRTSNPKDEK